MLGASGLVGSRLVAQWREQFDLVTPTHSEVDVLDAEALNAFVGATPAMTVVNAVGWADVDGAEAESGDLAGRVYQLNVQFPQRLAQLCSHYGKYLVHISTDYVFNGTKSTAPYVEEDLPDPICWYAETKHEGERAVRATSDSACIARIEMPFTGRDHTKRDLARTIAVRLEHGQPILGVTDQRITPVFLEHCAMALKCLVQARYRGTIHIAAADSTTPFDFASGIATRLHLDQGLVRPETFERFSATRPARRPQHSWLDVSHFTRQFGTGILKSVEAELDAWAEQWQSK